MRKNQDQDAAAIERLRSACAAMAGAGIEHIPIGNVLDLMNPAGQWKTLGQPAERMSGAAGQAVAPVPAGVDPLTGCAPVTARSGFRAADAGN